MLIPQAMLETRSGRLWAWVDRHRANVITVSLITTLLIGALVADRLLASSRAAKRTAAVPAAAVAQPARTLVASTIIASVPQGAEVVQGGAVIGNTPVSVPREATPVLYLLRFAGHEAQLVKIHAGSSARVTVTLATQIDDDAIR